jgi:GTPase KRas protein
MQQGLLEHSFRIVMVGAGSVGKTAISLQFVRQQFVTDYDPTIEDSYRKQIEVDGDILVIEVLDTAGQDDFKTMREQWIRQGHAFFIVYSITSRNSFSEITNIRKDIERIRDTSITTFPCLLFGNKSDMDNFREVSTEEGEEISKSMGCILIEGSAKLDLNLEKAYFHLLRLIKKNKSPTPKTPPSPLPYGGKTKRKFPCGIL